MPKQVPEMNEYTKLYQKKREAHYKKWEYYANPISMQEFEEANQHIYEKFLKDKDFSDAAVKIKCYIDLLFTAIRYVSHDEVGEWQFLCGKTHEVGEAKLISLESIFTLDSSIRDLADMPCGYIAERNSKEDEWIIRKE